MHKLWKKIVAFFSKKELMISDEDLKTYKEYFETIKRDFEKEKNALIAVNDSKYNKLIEAYNAIDYMLMGPIEYIGHIKNEQDLIKEKLKA